MQGTQCKARGDIPLHGSHAEGVDARMGTEVLLGLEEALIQLDLWIRVRYEVRCEACEACDARRAMRCVRCEACDARRAMRGVRGEGFDGGV